jgi:hypothetical protein
MKDNEIGEHAECRRKVKKNTTFVWTTLKKSVFIHSVDTTRALWLQNLLRLEKE